MMLLDGVMKYDQIKEFSDEEFRRLTGVKRSTDQKKRIRQGKRIKNRNNGQKHFYSGKKKKHTLKSQVAVDKKFKKVICTFFGNGKKHDFRLFFGVEQ
jgi:hypothetical protein